jgi:hypothetical protein
MLLEITHTNKILLMIPSVHHGPAVSLAQCGRLIGRTVSRLGVFFIFAFFQDHSGIHLGLALQVTLVTGPSTGDEIAFELAAPVPEIKLVIV